MVPPTEEQWFVAKWGENDGPQHNDVDFLPIDDSTAIRQQTEARMPRGMQFTMEVSALWGCRDCCEPRIYNLKFGIGRKCTSWTTLLTHLKGEFARLAAAVKCIDMLTQVEEIGVKFTP